jgi:hypothetical protein
LRLAVAHHAKKVSNHWDKIDWRGIGRKVQRSGLYAG